MIKYLFIIDSNNSDLHNNLGIAYCETGQYEKAIDVYKKAVQMDPYFIDAYNNCGIAYARKGDKVNALEQWNIALKINPNYKNAFLNIQKLK